MLVVHSAGIDTSTLTTATFTPAAGDILVVKCVAADRTMTFGTPVGGGWAYTPRGSDNTASNVAVAMWSAPVTAGGTPQTVAVTPGGTANHHSLCVERWQQAALAPAPALTNQRGSGAPSASNSTVGQYSVVTWFSGDWAAVDGTSTRVYRSDTSTETMFRWVTGQFTGYAAFQQAAAPGVQTLGLTAPAGQTWSLLGIEIMSTVQVDDVGLPFLVMAPTA